MNTTTMELTSAYRSGYRAGEAFCKVEPRATPGEIRTQRDRDTDTNRYLDPQLADYFRTGWIGGYEAASDVYEARRPFKFSDGPWQITRSAGGVTYILDADNETVATIANREDGVRNAARRVEAAANARLIAEAPELFRTVVKLSKELKKATDRAWDLADKLDLLEQERPVAVRRSELIGLANATIADVTTTD